MFKRSGWGCCKLLIITISCLLLTGCVDFGVDEATLRKDISALLVKYRQGINNLDRNELNSIISSKFSFYDISQEEYINDLFAATFTIDKVSYQNIRIRDYKIFCDVEIAGSLIFKPELPRTPVFEQELPFMSGSFSRKTIFALAYEQDGLKLLAEDGVIITKSFQWGGAPPQINGMGLSSYRVNPGDSLDVKLNVTKGAGNDLSIALINGVLQGGYALNGMEDDNEINHTVHVPRDLAKGKDYEITAIALAGKINLLNPQGSILQGVRVESYSVPVR